MKHSRLMEIIREVIEEEMFGEDAKGTRRAALGWGAGGAGEDAKKMGLDYLGFGRYGKNGKTTHQSVDGKLTPVDQIQSKSMSAKGTPVKVSTSKPIGHKVADIGSGGKQHNVQMSPQWIKQNLPQDPDPELDPKRKGSPFEKSTMYVLKSVFEKAGFKNNQEVPKAEFLKKTGLTQDQLDAYAKAEEAIISGGKDPRGKGVPPIFTDTGDTVRVNDPWDKAQQLNMSENSMQKTPLKEMIREIINEELALESQASDDAKRQGLEYLGFGRYGKDGKMTHHAVKGKLQVVKPQAVSKSSDKPKVAPASAGGKVPPSDTPKTKTTTSTSDSEDRFGADTTYLQVRKGATPAQRKLVGKVANMFDKVATSDWLAQHMGKSMPAAEFEKMTGISPKAAKAFSAIVDDYEMPFQYWDDDNIGTEGPTVYIADPMDV